MFFIHFTLKLFRLFFSLNNSDACNRNWINDVLFWIPQKKTFCFCEHANNALVLYFRPPRMRASVQRNLKPPSNVPQPGNPCQPPGNRGLCIPKTFLSSTSLRYAYFSVFVCVCVCVYLSVWNQSWSRVNLSNMNVYTHTHFKSNENNEKPIFVVSPVKFLTQ